MTSYVNMMSDVRWTDAMHREEGQRQVRAVVSDIDEAVVNRRMWQLLMPLVAGMLPAAPTDGSPDPFALVRGALAEVLTFCQPLTSDMFAEIIADGAVFVAADAATTAGRADAALLDSALDYEDARAQLQALPAAPTDGSPDPDADQRGTLTAQLAAATSNVTDLVAQRDAWRAAQNPPKDQQ